jgi:hypothetical protein
MKIVWGEIHTTLFVVKKREGYGRRKERDTLVDSERQLENK